MANRVAITVQLDSFEGPLDLLLYLIQSHEMDINRISIGALTEQFVAYVRLMQELNFDIASEFLIMAATLLHWKSKALLPQEAKPIDLLSDDDSAMTPEELMRQLLEHQRFLAAGQDLAQVPMLGEDVFCRPNRKPPIEKTWKELDISTLALSFQDTLVRARKRTTILKKETVSLTDKIFEFSDRLEIGIPKNFKEILSPLAEKPEIVVTFLASLELSRLRKMRLHQEGHYQEILLELLESLRGFDMNLARGFDSPIAKAEAEVQAAHAADALELLHPSIAHPLEVEQSL
ncbi:segregation/condensation protein A [Bdellovibrionota bacterium FG-1]